MLQNAVITTATADVYDVKVGEINSMKLPKRLTKKPHDPAT
jgi:hypothetical protein